MTELAIGPGTQVTLHFAIKMAGGTLVDSTFDGSPATFSVGDGNLLPGFEQVLMGLYAGDEKEFPISPEQGFGQRNPNNIQEIPKNSFADDIELEEGLMVSFADAQQAELPGVVAEVNDDVVKVDFNHPLAGRDLIFEVRIIAVAVCDGVQKH
ncbi:peptidylprolyl isomerase [uncultured Pseudoteredinibacter sp.]|uniref:FKBP-type peptidyl-prolyl cis-trans isomerase n=1 Tax=uncultured Pseudoteredinibacter sp. TaxID=1641701 RepID=UPI0026175F83|nr:peptidylprolyl isomerase [uncultured Pseudoteredinibacter sp.]